VFGLNAAAQPAPQAVGCSGLLEPAEPVAWTTTMWRNHENFDVRAGLAIEDVVRKTRHSIATNAGSKLNAIPLRIFTNFDHCRFKSGKVARAESWSLLLVVGNVLKVFSPCCLIEEVAHLSKACA
jgi:hypothetical protein